MNDCIEINQETLKKIRKEAEESFYKHYRDSLNDEIRRMFLRRLVVGGVEHQAAGTMQAIIEEQLSEFLLQDKTIERMKGYIEGALMPQLEACVSDSMRHAIRRNHFESITQKAMEQNKAQ